MEIEELQRELAASREKNGVYMESDKYKKMVEKIDQQRLQIENEKVSVKLDHKGYSHQYRDTGIVRHRLLLSI